MSKFIDKVREDHVDSLHVQYALYAGAATSIVHYLELSHSSRLLHLTLLSGQAGGMSSKSTTPLHIPLRHGLACIHRGLVDASRLGNR